MSPLRLGASCWAEEFRSPPVSSYTARGSARNERAVPGTCVSAYRRQKGNAHFGRSERRSNVTPNVRTPQRQPLTLSFARSVSLKGKQIESSHRRCGPVRRFLVAAVNCAMLTFVAWHAYHAGKHHAVQSARNGIGATTMAFIVGVIIYCWKLGQRSAYLRLHNRQVALTQGIEVSLRIERRHF